MDINILSRNLKRYIKNISNEGCDSWTKLLNLTLLAQIIDLISEQDYNTIKQLKDIPQLITDNSYIDFSNYIKDRIIYYNQMLKSSTASSTDDSVSCTKFFPYDTQRKISFDSIIGLNDVKKEITNTIINPLIYPTLYGSVSRGILLYGSPGTGKTLIVKAMIGEIIKSQNISINLYTPTAGELKGRYVGQSEKQISALFSCASKYACDQQKQQKQQTSNFRAISIIFLDEIDSIASDRSTDESGVMASTVNALLQAMQGIKSYDNVVVIGATNYPDKIDKAVLRRFTRSIHVRMPNVTEIVSLINKELTDYVYDTLDSSISETNDLLDFCEGKSKSMLNNSNKTWKKYQDYMDLSDEDISGSASHMFSNNYSPSDINRVFRNLRQLTAIQAFKKNIFSQCYINYNDENKQFWISSQGKASKCDISGYSTHAFIDTVKYDQYNKKVPSELNFKCDADAKKPFDCNLTLDSFYINADIITDMPNVYTYQGTTCPSNFNTLVRIDIRLQQTSSTKSDSEEAEIPDDVESDIISLSLPDTLLEDKINDKDISDMYKRLSEKKYANKSMPVSIWCKISLDSKKQNTKAYMGRLRSALAAVTRVVGAGRLPGRIPESKTLLGECIQNHTLYIQKGLKLYSIKDDGITALIKDTIDSTENIVKVKDLNIYSILKSFENNKDIITITDKSESVISDIKPVNPISLYITRRNLTTAVANIKPTVSKKDEEKMYKFK